MVWTPLKNISQLGWDDDSQYMEKFHITNQFYCAFSALIQAQQWEGWRHQRQSSCEDFHLPSPSAAWPPFCAKCRALSCRHLHHRTARGATRLRGATSCPCSSCPWSWPWSASRERLDAARLGSLGGAAARRVSSWARQHMSNHGKSMQIHWKSRSISVLLRMLVRHFQRTNHCLYVYIYICIISVYVCEGIRVIINHQKDKPGMKIATSLRFAHRRGVDTTFVT